MNARRLRAGARLLALALALAGNPASSAKASEPAIEPQPLISALSLFAAQRELQVVYVAEVASGHASPGAPGGLSTARALESLLAGTGLTFEFINERTVRIFRQPGSPQDR